MSSEKITSPGRYIKHPAAGSWLTDGKPLDTGSALIIDSNLSHLVDESYRNWIWEVRAISTPFKGDDGWTGLTDTSNPSAQTGASSIPWDQTVARRWGPFPALVKSGGTNGDELSLRKLKLIFSAYLSGSAPLSSHTWHFALTLGTFGSGRSQGVPSDSNTLWYQSLVAVSTMVESTYTAEVTGISRSVMDTALCRPFTGVGRGSTTVGVIPVNFWAGLETNTNSYDADLPVLSLFEIP